MRTGTRVPTNTGVPPRISGAETTRGDFIKRSSEAIADESALRNRCGGLVGGRSRSAMRPTVQASPGQTSESTSIATSATRLVTAGTRSNRIGTPGPRRTRTPSSHARLNDWTTRGRPRCSPPADSSAATVLADQRLGAVEQRLALEAALVHVGRPLVVDRRRDLDALLALRCGELVDLVAAIDRRLAADRVVALLPVAEPGRGREARLGVAYPLRSMTRSRAASPRKTIPIRRWSIT